MAKINNIHDELIGIAPAVANLGNKNLYQIPDGYFDNLAAQITSVITKPDIKIEKCEETGYKVPPGYFENFAANTLYKVKAIQFKQEIEEELKNISPKLYTIGNKNIFSIPENYFSNTSLAIPEDRKAAKVVSMKRSFSRWISYAAAASILFILSSGSYLYINNHLQSVDRSLTVGQRLATLNDTEIIDFLNDGIEDADLNSATPADPGADINHLLLNASDEDIQNFLDVESDPGEKTIKGI